MGGHSLAARGYITMMGQKIDTAHLDQGPDDPRYWAAVQSLCDGTNGCPMDYARIDYRPNMAGNVAYMLCFFALLGAQFFFGIKNKTWAFMAVISLGIIGEIAGYVGRIMMNQNPFSMDNFLTNLIPLTLAPALLTAGIYMALCRVIVAKGPENSILQPKLYTFVFIGFDMLSLVLQSIGGGMAATAHTKPAVDQGTNIMIGGLISQVISMIIFFIVWADFALRVRRSKAAGVFARVAPPLYENIRQGRTFGYFQWSLFVASLLIFVRCFYRVAELWKGFEGHLANDEATFMIFEGPMIIGAVLLLTIFHPGRIFGDLWVSAGKGLRGTPPKEFDDGASSFSANSNNNQWNNNHYRV